MTVSKNRYQRKHSIQIKIGSLMIAAVILLTATCWLLYRNLSSIVSLIKVDTNPELRLLSIRAISSEIDKAAKSVRIYTITRNPSDIKPYYEIIARIDERVNQLKSECSNDTVLTAQTDTISNLIEQNIRKWNELLILYRDDNVIDNLRQLSDQLNTSTETSQKQGILRRVFSRSNRNLPDEQEIIANLDSIVDLNQTARSELVRQELKLAENSSEITEKFYDLITKMENEVNENIHLKAAAAEEIADKTFKWLIMLAVSGGLLAILVIYIIIRYARNAYSYQVALENSKDEAEKLARTKEMFMANMSHEIRTPVTAISGFAEQLINESANESTITSLKIIKSSSDHLLNIIDDILDFSKLQNNRLLLEKVHFRINQIVQDVFIMFDRQARQNNTNLTFYLAPGTPPVLFGDPYRLKQIMINLISNSVKFTKNGSVHFSINCQRKSEEEIELLMEFSDTGIGIDESRLMAVFEDFTQAEMSTTRKYGGTGLGLSIVKKLIELHKGTIDLISRKNKGTTIVCRLPYKTGDEQLIQKDISHPEIIPEHIKRKKILVSDDEEYNRMLFSKILDKWNVSFTLASSGSEALDILKEHKFDLLLIDMLMPGIDGLKTTRFIREEMGISKSEMPIIMISAAPPKEELGKYTNAGINSFLLKPFSEEKLLSAIISVLRSDAASQTIKPLSDENRNEGIRGKIDLSNLYHISGGDMQFVKQMLNSFIRTTGKGLSDIKNAALTRQWENAANISHKIQSPCRHIGALQLYRLLNEFEKYIRDNENMTQIESFIQDALAEFDRVRVEIEDHITKLDQKPAKPGLFL